MQESIYSCACFSEENSFENCKIEVTFATKNLTFLMTTGLIEHFHSASLQIYLHTNLFLQEVIKCVGNSFDNVASSHLTLLK